MDFLRKKKWGSLEELKKELIKEGLLEKQTLRPLARNNQLPISEFEKLAEDARSAKTSGDFFNLTCQFSNLIEKLDENSLQEILSRTNIYILLLHAVFRNELFTERLILIVKNEKHTTSLLAAESNIEEKTFINAGVSLVFFSLAVALPYLKDANIAYLRKTLGSLIFSISQASLGAAAISNICFKLEAISWNNKYHFLSAFPMRLDAPTLFKFLKIARSLSGISFLSLTAAYSLGVEFRNAAQALEETQFNIVHAFSSIFGVIFKIENGVEHYYRGVEGGGVRQVKKFFEVFIRNNERNLLFFVKSICSDFRNNSTATSSVLLKIKNANFLRRDLLKFGKSNLKAFKATLGENEFEWTNKIFLTSIKTLSLLAEVSDALDNKWKASAGIFELISWVKEVHQILNRSSLQDDWGLIEQYLREENTKVEWKSTFFTATEQPFQSVEAEAVFIAKTFSRIVKTVLAMLNTDGGVIIVGVVERPESISREEILAHTITKNGKTFFDIGYELEKYGKTTDSIRLQLLESLKNITSMSTEKFNDLIHIEPVLLRDGDKRASVVKIDINKSVKKFFTVKKENSLIWLSLVKRASGQTIDVDIRDYIEEKKEV